MCPLAQFVSITGSRSRAHRYEYVDAQWQQTDDSHHESRSSPNVETCQSSHRGSWNCHSIVRTQPCEERQFLTSHEHIYRIDLHSTKTRKGRGYMPLRDGARWSCSIKSLRSKRNASCLVDRQ
jgi:hypothetical protein